MRNSLVRSKRVRVKCLHRRKDFLKWILPSKKKNCKEKPGKRQNPRPESGRECIENVTKGESERITLRLC